MCLEGRIRLTCGQRVIELGRATRATTTAAGLMRSRMRGAGRGARVLIAPMTPAAFEPLIRTSTRRRTKVQVDGTR